MPRLVAKTLKRVNADLEKMFDTYCSQDDLKGLDLLTPQPLALLYQTGYLTIKSYNSKLKRYRLGIPNREEESTSHLKPAASKTGKSKDDNIASSISSLENTVLLEELAEDGDCVGVVAD